MYGEVSSFAPCSLPSDALEREKKGEVVDLGHILRTNYPWDYSRYSTLRLNVVIRNAISWAAETLQNFIVRWILNE